MKLFICSISFLFGLMVGWYHLAQATEPPLATMMAELFHSNVLSTDYSAVVFNEKAVLVKSLGGYEQYQPVHSCRCP